MVYGKGEGLGGWDMTSGCDSILSACKIERECIIIVGLRGI